MPSIKKGFESIQVSYPSQAIIKTEAVPIALVKDIEIKQPDQEIIDVTTHSASGVQQWMPAMHKGPTEVKFTIDPGFIPDIMGKAVQIEVPTPEGGKTTLTGYVYEARPDGTVYVKIGPITQVQKQDPETPEWLLKGDLPE